MPKYNIDDILSDLGVPRAKDPAGKPAKGPDAKRHRIEPWIYLRELLLRLHDDDPRLDEMLPDRWAAQHPEDVLTYRLEESRRKAAARSSRRRHARAVSRPR